MLCLSYISYIHGSSGVEFHTQPAGQFFPHSIAVSQAFVVFGEARDSSILGRATSRLVWGWCSADGDGHEEKVCWMVRILVRVQGSESKGCNLMQTLIWCTKVEEVIPKVRPYELLVVSSECLSNIGHPTLRIARAAVEALSPFKRDETAGWYNEFPFRLNVDKDT